MIVIKLSLIKIETSGFRHFKACEMLIQGISKTNLLVHAPLSKVSGSAPVLSAEYINSHKSLYTIYWTIKYQTHNLKNIYGNIIF